VNRVVWSPRSLRDLESIRDFIAEDSPHYAELVVSRLLASVERLTTFPESGRILPELQRPEVREVIHAPFRIVYRLRDDVVEIATVFRSSRLFPGLSD
jgi:toxin ParE1/3/4